MVTPDHRENTMPYTEKRGDGEYPWRVRWPIPGKTTASGAQAYDSASGFPDEETARNYGLDMESDLRRGRYRPPNAEGMLLREWVEVWRANQVVSDRTKKNRDSALDLHLLPAFGDKRLDEITWWLVSTWGLAHSGARNSVRGRISLLSQILTAAVDAKAGGIEVNPIAGRKLGGTPVRRTETVWASAADAVALAERFPQLADRYRRSDGQLRSNRREMEHMAGMLRVLIYTIDGTGMRIGEALALHRDNCGLWRRDVIDGVPWRRRVIRVHPEVGQWQEYYDRSTGKPVRKLGPPKPPHGDREIDIPDYLWTMLEQHMATWPHPYLFCHYDTETGPDGRARVRMYKRSLFANLLTKLTDGRPERNAIKGGYPQLPTLQPVRPGLSAHGLRHGHNTAMIELGTPEIMRCRRMGHSIKGIQGVYSHPTPAMRKALLEGLEARHQAAIAAHAAPLPADDHFPEISQTITTQPRRKLRAV
jgi:integrase